MKVKYLIFVPLVLFIAAACSQGIKNHEVTDKFEKGKVLSQHRNKKLKEVSGLATSIANKDMLWTHNDSGNDAEIFLLDESLNIKSAFRLAGIKNRDWEDIAVGPGPDASKTYVYVGDIGDNNAVYPYKYIYRFEEPVYSANAEVVVISDFDTIIFQLDDGIKDTESLMIDSGTKNLYVVSKREDPVYVYELKYSDMAKDTVVAKKKISLPLHQIVAADYMAASGDVLMKNYQHIYYWENTSDEPLITLLKKQPVEIPYVEEPQGESITWKRDGSGFYTLSEMKKKKPSSLYLYSLKKNISKN
ncbi:hypothetical protein [Chryseolinea sp. H1M3-3]|uniref:hypothetical protein n=1 Tax=Chryseolinea sp. H1M3-3 TaxID=3034144 RepID=UPI0023ED4894|nr:hypothetical protein [Chryseolinea sp. H1M3-3]